MRLLERWILDSIFRWSIRSILSLLHCPRRFAIICRPQPAGEERIVPNTKSAKKDLLTNRRNRLRNQSVKSRLKTLRTKAYAAITAAAAASEPAVKDALKAFDSAATKGIIHKNTAARRKSRLTKRLNAAV